MKKVIKYPKDKNEEILKKHQKKKSKSKKRKKIKIILQVKRKKISRLQQVIIRQQNPII